MVAELWTWKHSGELNNRQSYRVAAQYTQNSTQQEQEGLIPTSTVWGAFNKMAEGQTSQTTAAAETEALATIRKLKLRPPTCDGNYATFDEWKYKFTAYMGIQDAAYPTLMDRAERATTLPKDSDLATAAGTTQEAESWVQLSNNVKYILISITTGSAATLIRQHQHEIGLEVYRQLCTSFSTPPLGTRSIGYLTKLLKPTFDHNNIEEPFSKWEFELWERQHNTTSRPSQNSSVDEWDKRTTPTAPTAQCRSSTNICRDTLNNHGTPQNHHSIHKTTTAIISCQK